MTAFKPATPVIPAQAPNAQPVVQPHVPHYPPKRIVTSRSTIGVPSTSPPPHVIDRAAPPLAPAKKEYAWQKNRALGKRF